MKAAADMPQLGPRQAARVAADYAALDAMISQLRIRLHGLAQQHDQLEPALADYARRTSPIVCRVDVVHAGRRYSFGIIQKRANVSYKSELLRHITADELNRIVAAQPLKESFEFLADAN